MFFGMMKTFGNSELLVLVGRWRTLLLSTFRNWKEDTEKMRNFAERMLNIERLSGIFSCQY